MTHSFPSRRSSDLAVGKLGGDRACAYRGIIGDDLEGQRRDAVAVFGKLELLEHRIGRAAMRGRGAESDRCGHAGIGRLVLASEMQAEGGRRLEIARRPARSEEHTSELQSLMRTSYAVFCLKNKRHRYTSKT